VSQGDPKALLEILSARDLTYENYSGGDSIVRNNVYSISDLLNSETVGSSVIKSDAGAYLDLEFSANSDGHRFQTKDMFIPILLRLNYKSENQGGKTITYPVGGSFLIDSFGLRSAIISSSKSETLLPPSQLIEARGLDFHRLRVLWNDITLTPEEEHLENAMRLLEPRLERIGFTSSHSSLSAIKVRLQGQSSPMSLSGLGDGMRRILALAMALSVSWQAIAAVFVDWLHRLFVTPTEG
jgi:hypothetical protein